MIEHLRLPRTANYTHVATQQDRAPEPDRVNELEVLCRKVKEEAEAWKKLLMRLEEHQRQKTNKIEQEKPTP